MSAEVRSEDSPNQGGWTCEQPAVQKKLWAIASRLKSDPACCDREDLVQEGLLQIWRMEHKHPGQTVSWYLQNAEFHMRDLLKAGRSLDSVKRRARRVELPVEAGQDHEALGVPAAKDDPDPMSQIYADDLVEELRGRLRGLDSLVFEMSLLEHGKADIGRRLKVSHVTVMEHQRRIAAVALELVCGRPCAKFPKILPTI